MRSNIEPPQNFELTEEQNAVVDHNFGPALVFAVAGAGKTTSMIHRIVRLVNNKIVPPKRILATSFNRANVDELKMSLAKHNILNVNCKTLHALGFSLIRSAVKKGYLPIEFIKNTSFEHYSNALIMRTIIALSREEDTDSSQLDIDREELENQISIWKNNLVYPKLTKTNLTPEAKKLATQAKHENSLYVRAYQIYEEERQREQWLTFDDMILTSWELLISFPDLRYEIQNSFEMVLVDEFQDLNLAQYEILSIIVEKHKNYMAIGDDDQCIYEWRGANPKFILGFEKEYSATVYKITDNFRCYAQHTMLANAVISNNKMRYDKLINLTRGFDGKTSIVKHENDRAMAKDIVNKIATLLSNGENIKDITILLRLYSQSPFIESELIQKNIAYDVVGNTPFYERHEITILFKYLAWALQEADIKQNGFPYDLKPKTKYIERFRAIINTPKRYISNVMIDEICNQATGTSRSVLDIISDRVENFKKGTKQQMYTFLNFSKTLIERVQSNDPANVIISWLIKEIDYENHLLEKNGTNETGKTKVQTVELLEKLAKGRGNCQEFLSYIINLSATQKRTQGKRLKIMTIYRSKGLEWKHVFIPNINQDIIPFTFITQEITIDKIEAERRLFYVGITRSKQNLYLYYSNELEISSFLTEITAEQILETCHKIKRHICGQTKMGGIDVIDLATNISLFNLTRYFMQWAKLNNNFKTNFSAGYKTIKTLFSHLNTNSAPELLQARNIAMKIKSQHFNYGLKAITGALNLRIDTNVITQLKNKANTILEAISVFDDYLSTKDLQKKYGFKNSVMVDILTNLGWVGKQNNELTLLESGRNIGATVIDAEIKWPPSIVKNKELNAAVELNKPIDLRQYISTSKLAWKLGVEKRQLFEYLVANRWLMKHGIRHILTSKGEQKGGITTSTLKGNKRILWPLKVETDPIFSEF